MAYILLIFVNSRKEQSTLASLSMKVLLVATLLGYLSLTLAATEASGTCYKTCVHGGWSAYRVERVGDCSVSCGGGQQSVTSTRTCTNPAPRYGGRICQGDVSKTESRTCNDHPCPIHGGWSAYRVERVGDCSVSCGGGQQNVTSTRTCTNPAPRYGGRICQGDVSKTESRTCNDHPCPIHGGWSAYRVERVGDCSVACGGGQQSVTSTRTCTNPAPRYGGRICQGDVSKTESRTCNDHPCPIDGGWSDYEVEDIGECSVTCGGGNQNVTSSRLCNNPPPQYGGSACQGDQFKVESRPCNSNPCPIDGGWSDYEVEDIGECSVTCGGGNQAVTSSRTCTNPPPQYGGSDCQGDETKVESQSCNSNPCPIDGGWSDWDDWQDYDECNALCGNGTKDQWRMRRCDNPAPAHGGRDCEGVDKESGTVYCNTQACGDLCPDGANTYLTNTNNTGRYYQCDHGVARLMACSNGTVWDQATTACVHDTSNPDCADGTVWDQTTSTCVHDTSNPGCADGTVWDESTETCVRDTSNPDCADGTVWDEATRMCVHDTSNPGCADGTVWDEATRMCVHDTSNPDCADGTVWDEASASCVHDGSQQMNQGDPCDSSVLMPHQDCTKYILCSNGVAHVMSCAPGLRYNDAAKGCDFEYNVPCN